MIALPSKLQKAQRGRGEVLGRLREHLSYLLSATWRHNTRMRPSLALWGFATGARKVSVDVPAVTIHN